MESSRRGLLNDMAEHRAILKKTKIRTTPLFFEIDLYSATSIESSRRDLLNDIAEHRSISKNYQNTHYSLIFQGRLMFSHINGKLSPRPMEWYCWGLFFKATLQVFTPKFSLCARIFVFCIRYLQSASTEKPGKKTVSANFAEYSVECKVKTCREALKNRPLDICLSWKISKITYYSRFGFTP